MVKQCGGNRPYIAKVPLDGLAIEKLNAAFIAVGFLSCLLLLY